jgi:hypothetical protein
LAVADVVVAGNKMDGVAEGLMAYVRWIIHSPQSPKHPLIIRFLGL